MILYVTVLYCVKELEHMYYVNFVAPLAAPTAF